VPDVGHADLTAFPPSSFPGDPQGYAANQAGHAFVGVALAVVLTGTLPEAWAWVVAGVAYWVFWERIIQHGSNLRDSYEDAVFVTCGAALWCTSEWVDAMGVLGLTLALMGIGVWRRK
jgi:hypothetical protein